MVPNISPALIMCVLAFFVPLAQIAVMKTILANGIKARP
jgi:hypothetical protein